MRENYTKFCLHKRSFRNVVFQLSDLKRILTSNQDAAEGGLAEPV